MKNSDKLLDLYDELIVKNYKKENIDEKDVFQEWYDTYKAFMERVQDRIAKLKNGEKLNYDDGDQEFLDELFVSSNPVSSRGSNPIPDEVLKDILRNREFTDSIEQVMLNPNRESWGLLNKNGKEAFKVKDYDNQPFRFNRISASCTINLIPLPSDSAFKKLVKYLSDYRIIDFDGVTKNWYAQNEHLTKQIHEIFRKKILDINDFTDEYWLNLFAWSLYDKKVNQSESKPEATTTLTPTLGTENLNNSLNRILFGAAGTGKTYNTINHALSIIENTSIEVLANENRTELKKRFDEYKNQGQIKFVTFHQSFSYEDFVEGIRAETTDGNLTYDVKDGVFKELCAKARQKENDKGLIQITKEVQFGRGYFIKKMTTELIEIQKPNGNIIHLSRTLAEFLLKEFREKNITVRNLADKKVIDVLGESPLLEPFLVNGYSAIWANLIPFLDTFITNFNNDSQQNSNYVLIVDEINRGNISRIFGELITLIEDSKRAAAAEELSVTLPYSKKEFTVPKNLYILGTMNSSDRSLTGLDIALRRRFTFIEMPPQPELLKNIRVEGLNIGELLKVINQRIEVLLDRDHCIGHANFMTLTTESKVDELAQIFKQKIIPQLQEYFFDDWAKINMVLNANGMLKSKAIERSTLFPNVDTDSEGFFEEQKIWQLVETAFDSVDSFNKIIKH
ncbi:McrB family protein [Acinetobacter gerneri]|jgi:hypothetical protein|uniref:McrB family protein n=1 Tax=Acinetobacter gerneri TaxID=202952 RepID=UPI0023F3FF9B|nr:AAA family ATPase [Acinetobacter gerneri]MCH4243343.1 AAA family ATPase [Acinetobacter gerneri]